MSLGGSGPSRFLVSADPCSNYPRYRYARNGGLGSRRQGYKFIAQCQPADSQREDTLINEPSASQVANTNKAEVGRTLKAASVEDLPPPAQPLLAQEDSRGHRSGSLAHAALIRGDSHQGTVETTKISPAEVQAAKVTEAVSPPVPFPAVEAVDEALAANNDKKKKASRQKTSTKRKKPQQQGRQSPAKRSRSDSVHRRHRGGFTVVN